MSLVVEQQDEVINIIESQAAGVEVDTEAGYVFISLCYSILHVFPD